MFWFKKNVFRRKDPCFAGVPTEDKATEQAELIGLRGDRTKRDFYHQAIRAIVNYNVYLCMCYITIK